MRTAQLGIRQLIPGAGGALLIVALFLPWAEAGGVTQDGWQLWTMADLFFFIVACLGLLAAVTGGHFGLFRADASINGIADLFAVVATVMLVWLLAFDFPSGASREIGVYLALVAAMAIAGGVGQYRMPQGGWFPRTTPDRATE